jgi:hypothetical protein
MKPSCQACGSPLLEIDTHCFRCGAEVQEFETPSPPDTEVEVDLRTAALYGGVIMALLIVGAVLMNWMGAGTTDPLAPTATPPAPAGWSEIIAPQGDFLIWLPRAWHVYTPDSLQWRETAGQVNHPLPARIKSEGLRDAAERLVMVARSSAAEGERPAELSVAYYADLVDLSLGVLQTDTWWAGERWLDTTGATRITRHESGEWVLIADLIYPAGGGDYTQSVTMILKTAWGVYVVTVSAMEGNLQMTEEIDTILDSFQPLDSPPVDTQLKVGHLDTPISSSYNPAL